MKNQSKIVYLLDRVIGSKGQKLKKQNEYMYWSPFISHHKPKLLKIRQSEVASLRKINGNWHPNYNKLACKYFDWLNMYMDWNGKHAGNGGECRIGKFWLDYYEPNLNIVIEWDEAAHYKEGKLRSKDIHKQSEIIKSLKCDFFRINESEFLGG